MKTIKTIGTQPNQFASKDEKNNAIISYLTVVGLAVAYFLNKNKPSQLAQFHIRQNFGLFALSFITSFFRIIPAIGNILLYVSALLLFILWLLGLISALKASTNPLPIVGEKFQQWFKNF